MGRHLLGLEASFVLIAHPSTGVTKTVPMWSDPQPQTGHERWRNSPVSSGPSIRGRCADGDVNIGGVHLAAQALRRNRRPGRVLRQPSDSGRRDPLASKRSAGGPASGREASVQRRCCVLGLRNTLTTPRVRVRSATPVNPSRTWDAAAHRLSPHDNQSPPSRHRRPRSGGLVRSPQRRS